MLKIVFGTSGYIKLNMICSGKNQVRRTDPENIINKKPWKMLGQNVWEIPRAWALHVHHSPRTRSGVDGALGMLLETSWNRAVVDSYSYLSMIIIHMIIEDNPLYIYSYPKLGLFWIPLEEIVWTIQNSPKSEGFGGIGQYFQHHQLGHPPVLVCTHRHFYRGETWREYRTPPPTMLGSKG